MSGDPQGEIYLLATRGIVAVKKGTWNLKLLAQSPVSIEGGGDFLDGRIYFISGSDLYSWRVADQSRGSVK